MKEQNLETFQCEGYESLLYQQIPCMGADGLLLRHKKTGARIILLAADDPNKVFCMSFRTTPTDSTGVPHIVEHSVLCGSEKYPVKDPFTELCKGSLATFLNAFTYPDKTMYPCASCNDKDFRNLMDVYLDAVLHPNICREEKIFRQEGWRYEIGSRDDDLTINGVVYNEMKGVYSDPEAMLDRAVQSRLFPDTTYGVASGGDPKDIPNLTYEQFKEFHRTHYSPSNSYIYLYGDMDMADTLRYIDEKYLSAFDKIEVDTEIPLQAPTGSTIDEIRYSVGENESTEEKTYFEYAAVVGDTLDVKHSLAWKVLENVLLGSEGAPLKKLLTEKGIGKDIDSGVYGGMRQNVLVIVVRETEADRAEEFRTLLYDGIAKIAEEGINRRSLHAALNRLEFNFRENDTGGYPKGISYATRSMMSMLYDDLRPFDYLDQLGDIAELRKGIDEGYFEQLLRDDFLNSNHNAMVIMTPERGLNEKEEKKLAGRLAAKKASLSEAELDALIAQNAELKAYQERVETEEELDCIPMLTREDLNTVPLPCEYTVQDEGGIPVVWEDNPTNGIAYVRLSFDATDLPEAELPYFGLMAECLRSMDTEKYSYHDLNDEIDFYTGGIENYTEAYSQKGFTKKFLGHLTVRGRSLYDNIETLLELMTEFLCRTKWDDTKRILEIINQLCVQIPSGLEYQGNSTVLSMISGAYNPQDRFRSGTRGLLFYRTLKELQADFDSKKDDIVLHLKRMLAYCIRTERLTVNVSADREGYDRIVRCLTKFRSELATIPSPKTPIAPCNPLPWDGGYADGPKKQMLTYSGLVQFVGAVGNYMEEGYRYNGALSVLKTILSNDYLWNRIRVLGGAYGAFIDFAQICGDLSMVTYRDPKLTESFDVFEGIPEYVESISLSDKELLKYIIGSLGGQDVPLTPRGRQDIGAHYYFTGLTYEEVCRNRQEVLNTTSEQLKSFAPMIRKCLNQGYRGALAGETKAKECAELFDTVETLR